MDNLRIVTWKTVFQKTPRTVLPSRGQGQLYMFLRQRIIHQSNIFTVFIVQICMCKASCGSS